MKQELLNRFLSYVKEDTRSDESSHSIPSTPSQVEFAKKLVGELQNLHFSDVSYNADNGFVTATVLPTTKKKVPTIGFISHMDTADFESRNIKPQIHKNYDGKTIILNEEDNIVLDPSEFVNLSNYVGDTLITTDGKTLLGADDKAGIAEIITAMSYLIDHPEIEHGLIRIAFGPDEEIGRGADHFDVESFASDYAYTVDGGPVGELQYECFNACSAVIKIKGKNVHPGTAKGEMVNALEIARQFQNALPSLDVPEKTSDREGFYHLVSVEGTVEEAKLVYIVRDHSASLFEYRKDYLIKVAEDLNSVFGDRVTLELADQYYNMIDKIKEDMWPVEIARKAMEKLSIEPIIEPIRGGTDGSKISFMGLLTPNLFAGGENFHGRYEFVSLEAMEKATKLLIQIAQEAVVSD